MRRETVETAIALCERYGLPVTVANVAANIAIPPREYGRIVDNGLKREVAPVMRGMGLVTISESEHTKVEMVKTSLTDLRELRKIKAKNARRVQVQLDALDQLIAFLEAKECELGYEPYVYQFEEDARRIYQMHGLELPTNWGKLR